MRVDLYKPEDAAGQPRVRRGIVRAEVPLEHPSGVHTIILLDADDTFDIVINYPDGERECVWSIIKDPQ
jgi:hypothetical protein